MWTRLASTKQSAIVPTLLQCCDKMLIFYLCNKPTYIQVDGNSSAVYSVILDEWSQRKLERATGCHFNFTVSLTPRPLLSIIVLEKLVTLCPCAWRIQKWEGGFVCKFEQLKWTYYQFNTCMYQDVTSRLLWCQLRSNMHLTEVWCGNVKPPAHRHWEWTFQWCRDILCTVVELLKWTIFAQSLILDFSVK